MMTFLLFQLFAHAALGVAGLFACCFFLAKLTELQVSVVVCRRELAKVGLL